MPRRHSACPATRRPSAPTSRTPSPAIRGSTATTRMWTTTVSYSTSVCRSSSPTAKSGLSSGASSALKRLSLTRQYIAIQLRNPTNFSASTIIISALGYYGKAALIERVLCAHFSTFKADHENWGTRLLRSFGNSYNTPYGVTSYAQNILSLHIKVHHVGSRPV